MPAPSRQFRFGSLVELLGGLARDHRRVLEALDVADIVRLQGAEALADGEQILVADLRVDGAERARRVLDRTRIRRAVLHLDFEGRCDVRALRSHDDSPFNGRSKWDRGGLRDSREARRTACWLGGYSLALILLYGIDMSKASDFLEKILTLELTHSGQKASYYICAGTYRQSIGAGSYSS